MSDALRVIAIDGVLGAGKTTVARRLAERLGLEYLDTGAMYRCVGVACLRAGYPINDASALQGEGGEVLRSHAIELARTARIEVRTVTHDAQVVLLDGADVSAEIRTPEAARAASVLATVAEVRSEMVERQRAWARARGGGVLEGRDIATVVFPGAPVQLFLTADPVERARRRHAEQSERTFDEVLADLRWRDHNDASREVAPLTVAEGATVIDSTGLSLDEVVDRAVALAVDGFARVTIGPDTPTGPAQVAPATPSATPSPSGPASVDVGRGPQRTTGAAVEATEKRPSPFERRLWGSLRPILLVIVRVYFRATWEGLANIPKTGSVIIAPVHRSNVDTLLVPFLTKRRVRLLGKVSMWKFRPIGVLFDRLGAIKVQRGTADRESMKLCLDALRGGEPLVVYPEGTRKEGPVVEELFDGVAWLAARAQVMIVPVGIGGSADAMGRSHKFPRPKKVHLIVGRPIAPPATTGRSGLRACTAQLQAEMQELFDAAQTRVYGSPPR